VKRSETKYTLVERSGVNDTFCAPPGRTTYSGQQKQGLVRGAILGRFASVLKFTIEISWEALWQLQERQ
jgi:hypothetical protein